MFVFETVKIKQAIYNVLNNNNKNMMHVLIMYNDYKHEKKKIKHMRSIGNV